MGEIPTIFRAWTEEGERQLIALFRTLPADDSTDIESYASRAPFGGDSFGAADYDECMETTRPATPDEYKGIMARLSELGWHCRPVAERTPEMLAEFEAARAWDQS